MNYLAFAAENACVDADALASRLGGLRAEATPAIAENVARAIEMAKELRSLLGEIANAVARGETEDPQDMDPCGPQCEDLWPGQEACPICGKQFPQ